MIASHSARLPPQALLRRGVSLWPREHGAYGQLAFPLVTALAVASPTWPALGLAFAAVCAFLAHEPLLVALGHRGEWARRRAGEAARHRLMAFTLLGVLAAIASLLAAPPAVFLSLAPAALLAGLVTPLILRRQERSTWGEIAAAVTLSSFALPVAVAGGASWEAALAIAGLWATVFGVSTLTVRSIVGHGRPEVALVAALLAALGVCRLAFSGQLPEASAAAALVFLSATAAISVRPVPALHVRAVGWMLIALSALLFLGLVAGFAVG